MPVSIKMTYGASSVRTKWSTSSFSGGAGSDSKSLGKSSRTAYGVDAANHWNLRECISGCTGGNFGGPRTKTCCQRCGGGTWCKEVPGKKRKLYNIRMPNN